MLVAFAAALKMTKPKCWRTGLQRHARLVLNAPALLGASSVAACRLRVLTSRA